jgi:uncharacterized protein
MGRIEMTREETLALANRFMSAVKIGDGDALRSVYAENAGIWHTFDCLTQTREQNIRTLNWMFRHVRNIRYDDIRVAVTEDGFVQQHVMRADEPKFTSPAMLRAWCENGVIVRIEEYLDSAHTVALTDYIKSVRSQRPAMAAAKAAAPGSGPVGVNLGPQGSR